MRRLIAALALCGGALLAAGCGDGIVTVTRSASPSTSASTGASPSRDPKAQAICDDLHRNVLDVDAKAFGAELGKMIAARAQGNKTEAARAQQAAVTKLNEIAGKLRKHADGATDPRLRSALSASAANLEKLAADTDQLSRLDSLEAVGQTTQKFAAALSDVVEYCNA
jgi:hypothetical protein